MKQLQNPPFLRLNLGCGNKKYRGFWNTDRTASVQPDEVIDLEEPLPYPDHFFEEIRCCQVLQYLHPDRILPAIKEMLRVSDSACIIKLRLAHALNGNGVSLANIGHNLEYGFFPEDFWKLDKRYRSKNNDWDDLDFSCQIIRCYIELHANNWWPVKCIETWVNAGGCKRHKDYARTFISRLFPPRCIEIWLRK